MVNCFSVWFFLDLFYFYCFVGDNYCSDKYFYLGLLMGLGYFFFWFFCWFEGWWLLVGVKFICDCFWGSFWEGIWYVLVKIILFVYLNYGFYFCCFCGRIWVSGLYYFFSVFWFIYYYGVVGGYVLLLLG